MSDYDALTDFMVGLYEYALPLPQYVLVQPNDMRRIRHLLAQADADERKRTRRKPTFQQRLTELARKRGKH